MVFNDVLSKMNGDDNNRKDGVNLVSNEKEKQQHSKCKKKNSDEFPQAIAKIAVAQICESAGFQCFQQSALDTLSDVAVRYIREIGKTASFYATLANRTECNVFDVIQGLEDLGSVQGFSGASGVRHSFSGSGVVKDLVRYVGQAEEIAFAYSIPSFPVVREGILNPSFEQVDMNPPCEFIPSWLPKFPDPDKFLGLDIVKLNNMETGVSNQIQKVDSPLLSSQPKFNNGSESAVAVELGDAAKAQQAAESNPFLADPLQFGAKDIFLPVIPAKLLDGTMEHNPSHEIVENHISAFEHKKDARGSLSVPEDKKNILLYGRPAIHFKFGNANNSLCVAKSSRTEGVEVFFPGFSDESDGEDKKNSPEQILSENMECTEEAHQ